jgi:hypothetical protein
VLNARWQLDRDGELTATIPDHQVQTSADVLAPALAAS